MLLALPTPHALASPSPAHTHTRSTRRPKLSLQITADTTKLSTSNRFSSRSARRQPPPPPTSAVSPTSKNTYLNATMFTRSTSIGGVVSAACDQEQDDDVSSSSSSSSSAASEDDDSVVVGLKDKKRRRRFESARPKHADLKSSHHPTSHIAAFGFPLPPPQPAKRGASPSQRRVRFLDAEPEVFYRRADDEFDAEPEADAVDDNVQTAMERMREMEQLKKWVEGLEVEGGDEGAKKEEWVRKLVRMELEEIEKAEQRP